MATSTASASNAAEVLAEFQAAVKSCEGDSSKHAPLFSRLLSFAEDPASANVAARVKILQHVIQHVGDYDATMCKKVAQLAVKLLSGDESVDSVHVHALKTLVSLAKIAAEKRPDYFAREGSDVLIQVLLDEEDFSATVRAAAKECLYELAKLNLKSVLTKLVHLISDDREQEEPAQLAKERSFAVDMLLQLTSNKKEYSLLWTEDVQSHLLTCLTLVLPTVPKSEFTRLLEVASHVPIVRENNFKPLLDAFLASSKLEGERGFEGLSMIASLVPRTLTTYPVLGEKLLAQHVTRSLDLKTSEVTSLQLAQVKVLVLASRLATPESAPPLMAEVLAAVVASGAFSGDVLPENLTLAEGLILSLCYLGAKCGQAMLLALSDPTLTEKIAATVATLELSKKMTVFYLKKNLLNAVPTTDQEGRALMLVDNLIHLLKPLSERHLPSLGAFVPSWDKSIVLPTVVKRTRQSDADQKPAAKAARTEGTSAKPQPQQQQQKKAHGRKPLQRNR